MARDPRIDDYIERAQPFAQPILRHIRDRVHAVVPDADETVKWGMPSFTLGKSPLLIMAAFKAHATLSFWRGSEIADGSSKPGAMGQFGRITAVSDLPSDLDTRITEAARLAREVPPARKAKTASKPDEPMHPHFAEALARSAEASAFFDRSSPGCRREYLEWINQAKRDDTRARRIETAVAQLAEGKKLHWKYEKC